MSLTTYFQFTETSSLPLPPPNQRSKSLPPAVSYETEEEIRLRGIRTAIKMLHTPETMSEQINSA